MKEGGRKKKEKDLEGVSSTERGSVEELARMQRIKCAYLFGTLEQF